MVVRRLIISLAVVRPFAHILLSLILELIELTVVVNSFCVMCFDGMGVDNSTVAFVHMCEY